MEAAARHLQSAYRRARLRRLERDVRERLTCSVCGEAGDSFLCRNGHAVCRDCLLLQCATRRRDCCVCRDGGGFYPSPFVRQADAFAMRWRCADCPAVTRYADAARHRACCPERTLTRPVAACGLTVRRPHLMQHLRLHAGRDFVNLDAATCAGIVCHGVGRHEALLVAPALDLALHVTIAAHHEVGRSDGGGGNAWDTWYSLHMHAFGDAVRAVVRNLDPADGAAVETFRVDLGVDQCVEGTSPVLARMRALASRCDSAPLDASSGGVTAVALHGGRVYEELRRGAHLPPRSLVTRHTCTMTPFDPSPARIGLVLACVSISLEAAACA